MNQSKENLRKKINFSRIRVSKKEKKFIRLIWENFEENKKALGLEMTKNFYESKLKSPEIFNTDFIKEKIEALENGNGQTYFEIIAEIIAEHSNIKLIEK